MQFLGHLLTSLVFVGVVSAVPASGHGGSSGLPVVDLGYVKHQAAEYNETAGVYVYRNIRFAAPPVGKLRLKKPQPPLRESGIQNGTYGRSTSCAQTNGTALLGDEDCLFLDIYVPKESYSKRGKKIPVLAWWFDGGYVVGSKEAPGAPWGLYEAAKEPFIFVTANYRLGALGFIAPPDPDVDTNIGLHDTRMAMEWIGKHISKFGADTEKMTAIGLSAGAGVIMHAIVSYGGKGPKLPFQQAILQSPGWVPEADPAGRIPLWEAFKANTGCANATCIRSLPSMVVQAANALTIGQWMSGALGSTSGLYPVVDGDYIPDFPVKLLAEDKFHKEIKSIISSSSRHEGGLYVPTNITNAQFPTFIGMQYSPNATIIGMIAEAYPSDGSITGAYRRAVEAVGDLIFNCNGYWLARAFSAEEEAGHSSRRYMFNIGPAIHGSDLPYTWNQGGVYTVENATLARMHQELIVDYTLHGDCALDGWPEWSEDVAKAMWLNGTGLGVDKDYYAWAVNVDRCEFLKDEIIGKG
ncbi:Alpha/Beta hydrolase protein [Tricharina praecox]|uniref:Alpha/Beta hydrolase protein n=1 Tax=Tricharina praecox TaxID=43433 RepID=UPI00222103FC|nr:Alpha/Beta hydrolase protein [Tricharina praecox]KAI5846928.1 Alpha/Beta hydrolase protein [Tricharina praecox]